MEGPIGSPGRSHTRRRATGLLLLALLALADGSLRDLAVGPMGETVLALQGAPPYARVREEITVVRVGR